MVIMIAFIFDDPSLLICIGNELVCKKASALQAQKLGNSSEYLQKKREVGTFHTLQQQQGMELR